MLSRLNDKKTGRIIIIMQRLHEDDLTGHLIKAGGWRLVSLPAIAEVDEEYRFKRLFFGTDTVRQLAGEALHPERESLLKLQSLRASMGAYNFAGQYQQSPAPHGGGMVKTAWFKLHRSRAARTFRVQVPKLRHRQHREHP